MKRVLWIPVLLIFCSAGFGKEIFVDYSLGKKDNPGTREKPLPDFASGIRKLQPGDTLKIQPSQAPIRDWLHVGNLNGTPEKPIIIDGSFNIFDGSIPLDPNLWKEVRPGIFRRERITSSNMVLRCYLIHNGRGVYMGHAPKGGKNPPFKKVEDLRPGEWTILDPEPKSRKNHAVEIFLRLGDGEKTPADGKWEEPSRLSGVHIASQCTKKQCGHTACGQECSHVHCGNVIFRNVIVRHFWNDGFNIHGKAKGVVFENIAAVECGDDGFSAHEAAEVTVRNYVSIGNATGVSHIQQVNAHHENLYFEGSRGVDFFPMNGTNTLVNVWVKGDSRQGVVFAGRVPGELKLRNCLFVNHAPGAQFRYLNPQSTRAVFDHVRICGYRKPLAAGGIEQLASPAEADAELARKRAEFFRIFGGALERACGTK